MNQCPFCHLDDEKQRVIRKNDLTTTFLSNPRLMPGHTLVVPNRHIENPAELTAEELVAIFEEIKWVEAKLLGTIAEGCDIRQHYRPFLPQGRIKIDHVHFHVLPRTDQDDLYTKATVKEINLFQTLSNEEREQIEKLFEK